MEVPSTQPQYEVVYYTPYLFIITICFSHRGHLQTIGTFIIACYEYALWPAYFRTNLHVNIGQWAYS
jgi:hypothetical protein